MKNKRDLVSVPLTWLGQAATNVRGIANVLDMIHLRPFPGGLVDERHPFCTGLGADGVPVWWSNVIFRSPGSGADEEDQEVVRRVGNHLRAMARRAARTPEFPEGMPSRMPAAILYLHGAVHHNAGWLLFDDFADAIRHFTDRRFAREFHRFIREEKREPLIVFRLREYDRAEFGAFTCFMRSRFPWFANANGPLEPVLWGNPAPHPTVNVITGNWIRDTRALLTEEGRRTAPRAPIATRWFEEGPYFGKREAARGLELLLARFTAWRVRSRGAKGNLYFVDKEALAKGGRYVGSRFVARGPGARGFALRESDRPGVVALPEHTGAELLLAFSPTNFHCFLVAGDTELHPRLFWNWPAVRTARSGTVRAGLTVRFAGVDPGRIAAVAACWRAHPPARTTTCLDGALAHLEADFGIRLAVPPRGDAFLAPVLVSILSAGFIDRDGEPVPAELYGTLGLGEGALAQAMAESDADFRGRARFSRTLGRFFGGQSREIRSGSAFPAFDLSRGAD